MKKEKIINGFTQLSNAFILDTSISFKAKGIFSLMASRPPNWKFNVKELASNSDKDGKNALRSGLKELRLAGYIQLKKEYDKEAKQLKGTRYTLTGKHLLLKNENNRDAEKLAVRKPEVLKASASKELEVKKPDRQLGAMLNNKENSNTDFNRKTQQQQKVQLSDNDNIDVADVSLYLNELIRDQNWMNAYIELPIATDVFLDKEQFKILLNHFANTSVQSETEYKNTRAVKVHFANWFKKNKSKDMLLAFIQDGKKKCRRTQGRINQLLKEVEGIIKALSGRNCKNIERVMQHQQLLERHNIALNNLNKHQLDLTKRAKLSIEIETIDYWINLVKRAAAKEELNWFCQKIPSTS